MPRITKEASAKWLELVSKFRSSDLPLHKFALEHEVSPHSLAYWLKKTRRESLVPPSFARIKVLPAEEESLIIHLENGTRLEVRGELAHKLLAQVLGQQI